MFFITFSVWHFTTPQSACRLTAPLAQGSQGLLILHHAAEDAGLDLNGHFAGDSAGWQDHQLAVGSFDENKLIVVHQFVTGSTVQGNAPGIFAVTHSNFADGKVHFKFSAAVFGLLFHSSYGNNIQHHYKYQTEDTHYKVEEAFALGVICKVSIEKEESEIS